VSGNIWIAAGVVCGAFALFAIPYGFHLKSKHKPLKTEPTTVASVSLESHDKEEKARMNRFYVDQLIAGHLTAYDLLASIATIEFVTDVRTVNMRKTVFAISYEDFTFSLDFDDGVIFLQRCQQLVKHRIEAKNPSEKLKLRIVYEPNRMGLLVGDNVLFQRLLEITDEAEKNRFLLSQYDMVRFSAIYPPNSMLEWVRKENLVPSQEYDSYSSLVDAVSSSLASLESKIMNSNMYAAFWDKNSGKTSMISPKREPEIHPTLLGLIQDECLLKSLEVSHEGSAGAGKLDFYIGGYVRNAGIRGICVEVKHAHSEKLKQGLTSQLPAYMKAKGADFGIYLVLWFKGKNHDKPRSYVDIHTMEDQLHMLRNKLGYGRVIRILTLDLSGQLAPSINNS